MISLEDNDDTKTMIMQQWRIDYPCITPHEICKKKTMMKMIRQRWRKIILVLFQANPARRRQQWDNSTCKNLVEELCTD